MANPPEKSRRRRQCGSGVAGCALLEWAVGSRRSQRFGGLWVLALEAGRAGGLIAGEVWGLPAAPFGDACFPWVFFCFMFRLRRCR